MISWESQILAVFWIIHCICFHKWGLVGWLKIPQTAPAILVSRCGKGLLWSRSFGPRWPPSWPLVWPLFWPPWPPSGPGLASVWLPLVPCPAPVGPRWPLFRPRLDLLTLYLLFCFPFFFSRCLASFLFAFALCFFHLTRHTWIVDPSFVMRVCWFRRCFLFPSWFHSVFLSLRPNI